MNSMTCKDVQRTIERLLADLKRDPNSWENPTLERYLEAMRAWLEGWDKKYHPDPSWELMKDMLEAGKFYE